MKLFGADPRLKQTLTEWAGIAPTLGLDADAFKAKVIWQKDEATRNHIVVRLIGSRNLILKRVFETPDRDEMLGAARAQRDAFDRLSQHKKAHASEILFANDDATLVVMTEVSGKTLNDHLTAGRSHAQMLRRTGRWLAAFHGSGSTENRTYQPRYMVGHVARMGEAVRDGSLRVALPELFKASCDKIPQMAEAAMDQPTLSAPKHGDFNLRNILLGPDGETGIDFKPTSTAPVGFDIARILMDYAELFQPMDEVPPAALLSDTTLEAFFDGYDLVGRDDPAVRFIPFVQLLNDWRLIPPNPTRRSWRQVARMNMIETLARNAFDLK